MFFVFVFSYFVCVFIKAYLVMDRFIQKVMANKQISKIISLNVRRIRNSIKRSSIFHILKTKTLHFMFYRKHIPNRVMSHSGKTNGAAKSFFLMALATVKELAYY